MTQQGSIAAPPDIEEAPQCRHYWVIQPASGPVSQGICQSCGESREFKNYVEGASWGDSRLANRAGGEGEEAVSRAVGEHIDSEEED